jgi:hypothetical protein
MKKLFFTLSIMKLVAFSLIFLLASCTADNENVNIKNEPPKAEFTQNQNYNINQNGCIIQFFNK